MRQALSWTRVRNWSPWGLLPAAGLLGLYLSQGRWVFKAPRTTTGSPGPAPQHHVLPLHLPVAPAVRLQGWLLVPPAAEQMPQPAVLYFGGRGEDPAWVVSAAAQLFAGLSVLVLNYRGFGSSPGRPSETALHADARVQYEFLRSLSFVAGDRVAVVGRSLGTAVAIRLAATHPVAASVLVTPYDSVLALARRRVRYLPVRWLLRHRFEAIRDATRVRAPTLVVRAEHDRVIPAAHTERLLARWPQPYAEYLAGGADHSSVVDHAGARQAISGFLQACLAQSPQEELTCAA